MKKPVISYSAMSDFRCLGDKCEDSCCRSWDISFDKKHFDLLKAKIINEGKDPTVFANDFVVANELEEKNFAQVIFDEAGDCPFLEKCGLCKIHSEYGVDVLSDVCTFFPRVFVQYSDRLEMSGSLSCPELVRKSMFSDENFELKPIDVSLLPRANDFPISVDLVDENENHYVERFADVREAMFDIMAYDEVSFEARLFSLSTMANTISSYYYSGCQAMQTRQLDTDLRSYSSNLKLTHTKIMLDQYIPHDPMAIIVVQAVLRLRLQRFPNENFSQLIQACFDYYNDKLVDIPTLPDGNFPPEALMNLYQIEAKKLSERYPDLLDKIFTRYVQNNLFRELYTSMPNLFMYIHMLTVRVAMLKFVIVSHPGIINILASDKPEQEQKTLIEEKIVEVIYQFSRSVDHNKSFLEIVFYAITEQQMMHFDYSLPFIKLQENS